MLEPHFRFKKRYIESNDPKGKEKPFFMGEVGMGARGPIEPMGGEDSHPKIYDHIYGVWMADYLAQCSRAGMDGAVAWMVDDAMHIMKDKESSWPDLDRVLWKKWGFFNSMAEEIGHPEDAALRPWYYVWSLMSRAYPRGTRMMQVDYQAQPGLRVLSGRAPDFGTTHMIVNDSDEERSVLLRDSYAPDGPKWTRYHYFADDRPTNELGYPIAKAHELDLDFRAGVSLTVPARGVLFLTNAVLRGHGDSVEKLPANAN